GRGQRHRRRLRAGELRRRPAVRLARSAGGAVTTADPALDRTLPLTAPAADGAVAARRPSGPKGAIFWLCAAWLALVAAAALCAHWLPLRDPLETDFLHRRLLPGSEFLLGTDELGRDILSRVVFGARISLIVSIGASLLASS